MILAPQFSYGRCIDNLNGINHILQLEDLNDDVLLETFDKLEFENWLDLTDTNYRFRELISQHIIRFNEQLVHFILNSIDRRKEKVILHRDSTTFIHDQNLAFKVLRSFGHVITRIYIDGNSMNTFPQTSVYMYINKYCSESLKELRIDLVAEDVFLE